MGLKARRRTERQDQERRLVAVNNLILCIAGHGRRFFSHGHRVSRLELDARGRVWFIDKYTGARIYTHYAGAWRGLSEGGTLRDLICALRDYVKRGTQIRRGFGPWPDGYCGGDPWGYGDDMEIVRLRARDLGILALGRAA